MVILKANDEQTFTVSKEIAENSILIKNMLADLGDDQADTVPIPLENITGPILRQVIDFAIAHKDDEPLSKEEEEKIKDRIYREGMTLEKDIAEIDKHFTTLDKDTLHELILAANYLDYKLFLDTLCKAAASQIKDKDIQFVRDYFNIVHNRTPEEEEQVQRELLWAEEKV